MDAETGHVVASCDLNDDDTLIHAVVTVVSRRRPS